MVCHKVDEDNTHRMVKQFFATLGWEIYSDAEKDNKPYDVVFSALGS